MRMALEFWIPRVSCVYTHPGYPGYRVYPGCYRFPAEVVTSMVSQLVVSLDRLRCNFDRLA